MTSGAKPRPMHITRRKAAVRSGSGDQPHEVGSQASEALMSAYPLSHADTRGVVWIFDSGFHACQCGSDNANRSYVSAEDVLLIGYWKGKWIGVNGKSKKIRCGAGGSSSSRRELISNLMPGKDEWLHTLGI